MANLQTTTDLRDYVLEGMGELAGTTSPFATKVVTQLVRCNRGLHAGGFGLVPDIRRPILFPWALSEFPVVVNFEAPIETGTVSVTKGSTSATLSDAPASTVAGFYLKVDETGEVYRVTAHTGGTGGLTLDAAYVGDTAGTATYDLFKIRYTFGSDILTPVSPIRVFWNNFMESRELEIVGKRAMERSYPLARIRKDFPHEGAIVKDDGDGTLTLQFNAYPEAVQRMEMDYITEPPTLDTSSVNPVMPVHQRVAIAEWTLFYMLREADDDRAVAQLSIARAQFDAMVLEAQGQQEAGARQVGRVIPRPEYVDPRRRILRTTDGFIIG